MRSALVFLLAVGLTPACTWAGQKPCVPASEAAKQMNKDVCVSAHVYDVVELPTGTRFLDLCSPLMSDEQCIFTIVSYQQDRVEVGDLARYRNADIEVRGLVEPLGGRAGMVLSHVRQFHGGPPKFRPNPKLIHGFAADQNHTPIADPNLRRQGYGRGFMRSGEQTLRSTLPAK